MYFYEILRMLSIYLSEFAVQKLASMTVQIFLSQKWYFWVKWNKELSIIKKRLRHSFVIYVVYSKSIANFVFFHEYLFYPFQSNPHQKIYTCANVFSNPRSTSKNHFLWSCSAPLSMPLLSPQSCRSVVLLLASSVLGTRNSHRGPGLGNTVAAALLVCCFWPKICPQATMCEQGRYHGAKANFCSSTNPGVSGRLLRANCA